MRGTARRRACTCVRKWMETFEERRDGGPELKITLKFSIRQPSVSVSFLQSYHPRDEARRGV